MQNKSWLILISFTLLPILARADRYGICEGSNCGGGAVNGFFAIIIMIFLLSFLGAKTVLIYFTVWLAPVIVALLMNEKSFATIWGLLGFYLSFIITAWVIDFLKADENKKIEKSYSEIKINNTSAQPLILDLEKRCFLIIVRQWTGGPYWVRAFPAKEVIDKLRKTNINEPNISKMSDIINSMEDYKFNLIDDLIDSGVEVISESIDKSRVKAIRAIRVNAKEKGWNIIISEFDTVTNL